MAFIDGLIYQKESKDSILLVVDRINKSTHFKALSHPYFSKLVAKKFIEGVVKIHGMTQSMISDRDPVFISRFWQQFFKMSRTHLKMTSAYQRMEKNKLSLIKNSMVCSGPKQNSFLFNSTLRVD